MRITAGPVLVCCVCALAGCGTSDSDQVRAKIGQFVTAASTRDYKTICEKVLAPSLLARLSAAGLSCPQAMQIALANVHDPSLSIGKIMVHGDRASAVTLSTAKGQQAALETIELTKTASGWRLESLGSPLTARQAK